MKEKLLEEITLVKNYHFKQDILLHNQFEDVKKRGDKFEIDRIISEDIRSQKIYTEAVQDLRKVKELDLSKEQLKNLKKKYDDYRYEIDTQKASSLDEEPIEEEHPEEDIEMPIYEETSSYEGPEIKEGKSNAGKYVAIGLAGALLGIGGTCALTNSNNKTDNKVETIDETQNNEDETIIIPGAEDVTPNLENNTNNLKLGEYGTFFDVTDNAQVEARANYIYETYYQPLMNDLSENEKSVVTVDNIANCIRVMNGELPLDENGNKVFNINVVDEYSQKYVNLLTNLPSSPEKDGWSYTPAYLFTTDGTKLQEFVKSYDDLYEQVVDGLNKQDALIVRPAVEQIGYKFWNEWIVNGMYGDVNPQQFDSNSKLFAFWSTIMPYGTTVVEYNIDSMQPVCVKVCVDYASKENKDVPVTELYYGILTGEYNEVVGRLTGIDVPNEPDSVGFTQDLLDELQYKYEHLDTMKLTK